MIDDSEKKSKGEPKGVRCDLGRVMIVKRFLDFTAALCALTILSPLLLIVAILIRILLGSPVLFAQERPGLHGPVRDV